MFSCPVQKSSKAFNGYHKSNRKPKQLHYNTIAKDSRERFVGQTTEKQENRKILREDLKNRKELACFMGNNSWFQVEGPCCETERCPKVLMQKGGIRKNGLEEDRSCREGVQS